MKSEISMSSIVHKSRSTASERILRPWLRSADKILSYRTVKSCIPNTFFRTDWPPASRRRTYVVYVFYALASAYGPLFFSNILSLYTRTDQRQHRWTMNELLSSPGRFQVRKERCTYCGTIDSILVDIYVNVCY